LFLSVVKDPSRAMYQIGNPYKAYSNVGWTGGGGIAV